MQKPQIPTVELHRHFEAGLSPQTIATLAQKNRVTEVKTRAGMVVEGVDPQDPESIIRYYRSVAEGFKGPGGFGRFIDSFGLPLSVLQSLEDLEEAAFSQIIDLHQKGSLHTELRGSPMSYQPLVGAEVGQIIEALRAGVERAFSEQGASGTYIAAFSRQNALGAKDGPALKRQAPVVCPEIARLYDPERPLGLDIAGFPEVDYPPRNFVEVLAPVVEAGVPITIHCGEQGSPPDFAEAPPELVVEAIELLGARRVGHGTCLMVDEQARQLVKEKGVGVECCPGSNQMMGFIDDLAQHPLKSFLEEGLLASISTDDPLMFGDFTVSELLQRGSEALALSEAEQFQLARNGILTAFISSERRELLLALLEQAQEKSGAKR